MQFRESSWFFYGRAQFVSSHRPEVHLPVAHRRQLGIIAALGIEVGAHSNDEAVLLVTLIDQGQQAMDERPTFLVVGALGMQFLNLIDDQEQRWTRWHLVEQFRDLPGRVPGQFCARDTQPFGESVNQLPYRFVGGRNTLTVITGIQAIGGSGGDESGRQYRGLTRAGCSD